MNTRILGAALGPMLGWLCAGCVPTWDGCGTDAMSAADGVVLKRALDNRAAGPNLLTADGWRPYEAGAAISGGVIRCDNGADATARRGVSRQLELNQTVPQPIVASAWSRATDVTGGRDSDYSLYLDLIHTDGTPLWGQTADFTTGTHDWERREVTVLPEKPVKSVSCYLLLRGHGGRAEFRDAELRVGDNPAGTCRFDGIPVVPGPPPAAGFQIRDAAAGSDFVRIRRAALGLTLDAARKDERGATWIDATLSAATNGGDRAVTLVYALPVDGDGWRWLAGPRREEATTAGREYGVAAAVPAGQGRLSRWPFAAIANGRRGRALGIDLDCPAVFRTGYNAGTRELFVSFDLGLTPEKRSARVRLTSFEFDAAWGHRAALARWYELFPAQFQQRIARQGLWMPFAKISAVPRWEDFGFRFKEGNDEVPWDDAHEVLTFRYTEPMTWWMPMAKDLPRTPDAALAEANRRAEKGDAAARALLASGFRDEAGGVPARLLDTPWCKGAVWSMNSMPGVAGDITDFQQKWNPALREQLYGPARKGDLDGEYVDSSEGYVTDVLDFRREHFAAADTPLTFSPDTHRPAVFRGLIAFEYVRALERDVHGMGRFMMANATPHQLCWLAPLLDVLGTETDWNPGGSWRPMSDEELLYRRALCRGKPYCFLMNTDFRKFPMERTEKYMRRALAYGMFPGFFSSDASTGHYFTRPELYERDRPVFRRYLPLCTRVAEAGWEPVTCARSSDERVHVERFGNDYLTVFNDSDTQRTATITLDGLRAPAAGRDLVSGAAVAWTNGAAAVTLDAEDVAVWMLR